MTLRKTEWRTGGLTLMSENAPYAVPSMPAAKAAKYNPAM